MEKLVFKFMKVLKINWLCSSRKGDRCLRQKIKRKLRKWKRNISKNNAGKANNLIHQQQE